MSGPSVRDELQRLEIKIDEIKSNSSEFQIDVLKNLNEINLSIRENDENLKLHMRRSELLEKQVEIMENEVKPVLYSIKGMKIIFGIGSGIVAILNILNYFKK